MKREGKKQNQGRKNEINMMKTNCTDRCHSECLYFIHCTVNWHCTVQAIYANRTRETNVTYHRHQHSSHL